MSQLLLVPILAVALGQLNKLLMLAYHKQHITLKAVFADGGMPSAHSALTSSLVTTIYLLEGTTTAFYVALFVTFIVIKDAFGVRRESGKHARVLREMMEDFMIEDKEKMKLVVGHTKKQVFFGLVLGVVVAIVSHTWLF